MKTTKKTKTRGSKLQTTEARKENHDSRGDRGGARFSSPCRRGAFWCPPVSSRSTGEPQQQEKGNVERDTHGRGSGVTRVHAPTRTSMRTRDARMPDVWSAFMPQRASLLPQSVLPSPPLPPPTPHALARWGCPLVHAHAPCMRSTERGGASAVIVSPGSCMHLCAAAVRTDAVLWPPRCACSSACLIPTPPPCSHPLWRLAPHPSPFSVQVVHEACVREERQRRGPKGTRERSARKTRDLSYGVWMGVGRRRVTDAAWRCVSRPSREGIGFPRPPLRLPAPSVLPALLSPPLPPPLILRPAATVWASCCVLCFFTSQRCVG